MRRYALTLSALDKERATFTNEGVVRVDLPTSVWRDDGRPTSVTVNVDMGAQDA
jgi:hypothetical protein